MKRYRVLKIAFDFRANMFKFEIGSNWAPEVKQLHEQNRAQIRRGLIAEFGEIDAERKFQDFLAIGAEPCSVIAFHKRFLAQARNAFVLGSYYPALTGACALGERILNHLILNLRDRFRSTPDYKHVYRKDSFDNWTNVIRILSEWQVLRGETSDAFVKLEQLRNESLHFNEETEKEVRAQALSALMLLSSIIDLQFGAMPGLPWFIQSDTGICFPGFKRFTS